MVVEKDESPSLHFTRSLASLTVERAQGIRVDREREREE